MIVELHLGDCLEFMRSMPDSRFDAIITSPPYDNLRNYKQNYEQWGEHIWKPVMENMYRLLCDGGVLVWVVADATISGSETGTSFRQALYWKDVCGGNIHDTMIYFSPATGAKGSNLAYWQAFEYMFVLSRGRPKTVNRIKDKENSTAGRISKAHSESHKNVSVTGTRIRGKDILTGRFGFRENVWRVRAGGRGTNTSDHPAPMPLSLAADHLVSWTLPGDLVFDPFMGSGTTGVACVENGRRFVGCELSSDYFAIAERRMAEAQSQTRMPI